MSGPKSWLAAIINRIEPLRVHAAKKAISRLAEACPPRPMRDSMFASYVTWPGLVDRHISGRHLPVCSEDQRPAEPPLDDVAALFERKTFVPSQDSSLLFPLFAQWFVDGFLRTKWEDPSGPRTFRENESNQEIDLNQIYGVSELQCRMLRDIGNRGRLKSRVVNGEEWPVHLFEERGGEIHLRDAFAPKGDEDGLFTENNLNRIFRSWDDEHLSHAWATGLEHGSSTLGQSAMNALFLREHNRVAGVIARAHPDWDDERVFQTTRNVLIVELLNIVLSDYIPHIAPHRIDLAVPPGWAEKQPWYRTNRIAVEFALLYRWHDLIPDDFEVAGQRMPAARLVRPNAWLEMTGLGEVLLGASRSRAGRIGLHNTPSFLNRKEGGDVKRLSVEMGRTCQLPPYNAYRRHYGLEPVKSFAELTGDEASARQLKAMYGSIERLEWFVGLFAEGHKPPMMMGKLLTVMVANDAFTQALTNPLLARKVYGPDTFSPEGMKIIKETRTLADIIVRNTAVTNKRKLGLRLRR